MSNPARKVIYGTMVVMWMLIYVSMIALLGILLTTPVEKDVCCTPARYDAKCTDDFNADRHC